MKTRRKEKMKIETRNKQNENVRLIDLIAVVSKEIERWLPAEQIEFK